MSVFQEEWGIHTGNGEGRKIKDKNRIQLIKSWVWVDKDITAMSEPWKKTRDRMARQWVKDKEIAMWAISMDRGMGCHGTTRQWKQEKAKDRHKITENHWKTGHKGKAEKGGSTAKDVWGENNQCEIIWVIIGNLVVTDRLRKMKIARSPGSSQKRSCWPWQTPC